LLFSRARQFRKVLRPNNTDGRRALLKFRRGGRRLLQ
jgi:hypothetical protein